jgi:hypothetical protein
MRHFGKGGELHGTQAFLQGEDLIGTPDRFGQDCQRLPQRELVTRSTRLILTAEVFSSIMWKFESSRLTRLLDSLARARQVLGRLP